MNHGLVPIIASVLILTAFSLQELNAESNVSPGGNDLIREYVKAGIISLPETVLVDDTFSTNLDGWTYESFCNSCAKVPVPPDDYSLVYDNSNSSSAHIVGDGYAVTAGMKKIVTIPSNANQIVLSFDGKAQGSFTSHDYIPNLRVDIFDTDDVSLYGKYVIGKSYPTSDKITDWRSFTLDITEYVKDQNEITLFLGLADSWAANHDQKVWIDNVKLIAKP